MSNVITKYGFYIALYSTVIILVWLGIFKFHPYEANAITSLVENSPLMSWLYNIFSVQGLSNIIGSVELIVAVLLALYPFNKKAALLGGILGTIISIGTSSFLFTTPGMFFVNEAGQTTIFPSYRASFLVKDLAFLGICIMAAGNALSHIRK